MDETDIALSKELSSNARLSYRELADKYDLSVNAIHKRIQNLVELGIIKRFYSMLSPKAVPCIRVIVAGRSSINRIDDTIENVKKNKSIYQIVMAADNYMYIIGLLKDISELDNFSNYVIKTLEMKNPNVWILQYPSKPEGRDEKLTKMDYQIVASVKDNARKEVNVIAKELHSTPKTIRRRLKRMIENDLIFFTLDWVPTASRDIITIHHLFLKGDAEKQAAIAMLMNKHWKRLLSINNPVNVPNLLVPSLWFRSMNELKEINNSLEKEGLFENITTNILLERHYYDTWRDAIPKDRSDEG